MEYQLAVNLKTFLGVDFIYKHTGDSLIEKRLLFLQLFIRQKPGSAISFQTLSFRHRDNE